MYKNTVIEVPAGLSQPGPIQFVRQLAPYDLDEPFCMDLPAVVRTCKDAGTHSVLPYGRLVLPGDITPRATTVTFEVLDELGLNREIDRLCKHIASAAPKGFAIRLLASRTSFARLADLAEEKVGNCSCHGGLPTPAEVPGAISVGLSNEVNDELKWSDPVTRRIMARIDDSATPILSVFPEFISMWLFDCYSEWFGLLQRSTVCRGGCTGTQSCGCRNTAVGPADC